MVTKREKARLLAKKKAKKKVAKKSLTLESKVKDLKVKKKLLKEQVELKREINKYTKLLKEASGGVGVDKIYALVDDMGFSKEGIVNDFFQYNSTDELNRFFESLSRDYDGAVDMYDSIELLGEDTMFTEIVNWMSTDEILEFVSYINKEYDLDDEDEEVDDEIEYDTIKERITYAIDNVLSDIDIDDYEYEEDYQDEIESLLEDNRFNYASIVDSGETIDVTWEAVGREIEITFNKISDDLTDMKNYTKENIKYVYDGDMNNLFVV